MSDTKQLTGAERLEHFIEALKTNKKQLANDLGYKSHQSIYFVTNGVNKFSEDMINRIILKFPEANPEFLRNGTGNPLNYKTAPNPLYPSPRVALEDLITIPERLDAIEQKLEDILKFLK